MAETRTVHADVYLPPDDRTCVESAIKELAENGLLKSRHSVAHDLGKHCPTCEAGRCSPVLVECPDGWYVIHGTAVEVADA